MVVAIIGGGASGMAAAKAASENPAVQVILFERQARLGRKLQATGNGRCNLSNRNAANGGYHGENAGFADPALKRLPPEATADWFRQMGLVTVAEPSGRMYPYSDQANSVADVLRLALERPNVEIRTGTEVKKITRTDTGFAVDDGTRQTACDRVIVACGGLAGTKLGGGMWGYRLLEKLGHTVTKLRPALVQIKSDFYALPSLQGVRANCHVRILHDGDLFAQSTGELQFTQYGLSGPVIFEISRDVCQESGTWTAELDFLPGCTKEELLSLLTRQTGSARSTEDLLTGIVHNRLGRVLTKAAGVTGNRPVCQLSRQELAAVCDRVKKLEVTLSAPMGMDAAQVTAGGIRTADFDPCTMESKLVPGLYACGEVLDIDGDCGGYNLQWAWSSGCCAGFHAGKETQ